MVGIENRWPNHRGGRLKSLHSISAVLTVLMLLGACTVGPDYVRPTADTPVAFKESQGWKMAQPRDQELRGNWWEAFNDPLLNEMMEQVNLSNQNLVQAAAQFRQARALVQAARAGYLPSVSANVGERGHPPASIAATAGSRKIPAFRPPVTHCRWMPSGNWTCGGACGAR